MSDSFNDASSAVILLSGGLDSTVALAKTLEQMPVSLALMVDYGQRALAPELRASKAIAQHYNVAYKMIELPWLAECLPKALDGAQPQTQEDWNSTQDPIANTHRVWVPNRNGVFLNIAASFAEALGASHIVFGANATEGETFPDNSVAFIEALNQSLSYSTLSKLQVLAPVATLTKAQMVTYARAHNVPLHLIWSCYEAGPEPCHQCPSCQLLGAALATYTETSACSR
ncbi:MAG: 7-cyano-7-deazaguanine synthase QueC [Vampirovibrionales bacterium]|nr:7-cyano-7-deazaguanine synthase QueC [Vampirovibrionales bacterium]